MTVIKGQHHTAILSGPGRKRVSFMESNGGKTVSIGITGPKGGNEQVALVNFDDFIEAAVHIKNVVVDKQ